MIQYSSRPRLVVMGGKLVRLKVSLGGTSCVSDVIACDGGELKKRVSVVGLLGAIKVHCGEHVLLLAAVWRVGAVGGGVVAGGGYDVFMSLPIFWNSIAEVTRLVTINHLTM